MILVASSLRARLVVSCSLALFIACADQTQVETQVRVGDKVEVSTHPWANAPDPESPDPEIEAAKQVLAALRSDWQKRFEPDASDQPTTALPEDNVTEPPRTQAEFDELLAQLRDGPIDEVGMPAHNLRRSSPELWEPLRDVLLGPRKGSKTEFKRIFSLFGGDVPNRYGHFALRWKKNHGYKVKVSDDWFKDLLSLPLGKVSSMLHPVYRDAVLTVAALHGAAHIGRVELRPDRVERAPRAEVEESWLKKRTPSGRQSHAEEVADAAYFLAGDGGANMIGQSIIMDGGRSYLNGVMPLASDTL